GGGGGGSGPAGGPAPVTVATSSGKAVDGYLSGSPVLCDTNNNAVADTGEAVVMTNGQGDFTFSPACAGTIVVSGGTNIDTGFEFKGRLKAPAGSTVVTPLTSLMVSGGLTAAQVAAALGLPAGTDVSKIDPMSNADLQKKTLAMQQIIQQVADALGGMAQNTSPSVIQAIYSEVAKAVATTLAASTTTPLVDASGSVSNSLVFGILQQSMRNMATTTDGSLATVKASLGDISPTSVAVLFSDAITSNAEILAKASNVAALIAQAKLLQANYTIENAASQLSPFLTTANEAKVSFTVLRKALQQLSDTDTSNDAAAIATITSEVAIDASAWLLPSNYLSIVTDNITFGTGSTSQTETLTTFQSTAGVTLAAKPDTVSFTYALNGTPIPAAGSVVSVGLEMTQASTGRKLQFILDQVNLAVANGQLTVVVPTGANLYVYGKTGGGASANLTIPNDLSNQLITTSGSDLTFNATNALNSIVAKAGAQPGSPFANLLNVKGTFTLKVLVSNLSIRSATAGAVKALAVSVTSATDAAQSIKTVSGSGIEGTFTLN
ncbi:MAG: hypothetical protein Q7T78_00515, partial [Rhodoferax sp.]|nr:hypothetical protein [Rhodoferax sp.]